MEKRQIIEIFQELKDEIKKRYKAEIMGVFCSYVRGDQREGSDVDILVRFFEKATLFDFVGLSDFLEGKLKIKTDIIPIDTVREEIKEEVLKEAIYL